MHACMHASPGLHRHLLHPPTRPAPLRTSSGRKGFCPSRRTCTPPSAGACMHPSWKHRKLAPATGIAAAGPGQQWGGWEKGSGQRAAPSRPRRLLHDSQLPAILQVWCRHAPQQCSASAWPCWHAVLRCAMLCWGHQQAALPTHGSVAVGQAWVQGASEGQASGMAG